jgi:surface antigen
MSAIGMVGLTATSASAQATLCSSPNYGYDCVAFSGYHGQSTWGYPLDGRGHNCTNYAAYRLAQNGAANPGNLGDAYSWDNSAAAKGFPVNGTPVVGSIAQWEATTSPSSRR